MIWTYHVKTTSNHTHTQIMFLIFLNISSQGSHVIGSLRGFFPPTFQTSKALPAKLNMLNPKSCRSTVQMIFLISGFWGCLLYFCWFQSWKLSGVFCFMLSKSPPWLTVLLRQKVFVMPASWPSQAMSQMIQRILGDDYPNRQNHVIICNNLIAYT